MARIHPERLRSRRSQDTRLSARERGYGGFWDRYSADHRTRYPLCIACAPHTPTVISPGSGEGLLDHIIPVRGRHDELFLEKWNHEGLCRVHHAEKTKRDSSIRDRITGLLELVLAELDEHDDDNLARNALLSRLNLWPKWLDIETGNIVSSHSHLHQLQGAER